MAHGGAIVDEAKLGYLIVQDHGFKKQGILLDKRGKIVLVRTTRRFIDRGDDNRWEIDDTVKGDLIGSFAWHKKTRETAGWMFAWPTELIGAAGAPRTPGGTTVFIPGGTVGAGLPIFDQKFSVDARFSPEFLAVHPDQGDVPCGTIGISLAGSREDTQENLFFPTDRRLIAVNHAGRPSYSSIVFDIDNDNCIDKERGAPLHSMMWVIRTRPGFFKFTKDKNALAWQLGTTGRGEPVEGYGLIAEKKDGQLITATMGEQFAGPLTAGQLEDQHRGAVDADGNPTNAGHIGLNAYYFDKETFLQGPFGVPVQVDGPEEFVEDFYRALPGPHRQKVDKVWDSTLLHDFLGKLRIGHLRWQCRSVFYVPNVGTKGPNPDEAPKEPVQPRVVNPNHEAFASTTMQTAFPTLLIQPQNPIRGKPDLRSDWDPNLEDVQEYETKNPLVLRIEGFGQVDETGIWSYQENPCNNRFRPGTAFGGIVFLPPEVDIADIATDFEPDTVPRSQSSVVITPGVRLSFGIPSLASGVVEDGHSIRYTGPGTDITRVEDLFVSGGVITGTPIMEWDTSGAVPLTSMKDSGELRSSIDGFPVVFDVISAGAPSGDAAIRFRNSDLVLGNDWIAGSDYSDQAYKICESTVLGTNCRFEIAKGGVVTLSGLRTGVRTITASDTFAATDFTILCNNTVDITVTFPLAANFKGQIFVVQKISASGGTNQVDLVPAGGDTIIGSLTIINKDDGAMYQSDGGTTWRKIANL